MTGFSKKSGVAYRLAHKTMGGGIAEAAISFDFYDAPDKELVADPSYEKHPKEVRSDEGGVIFVERSWEQAQPVNVDPCHGTYVARKPVQSLSSFP